MLATVYSGCMFSGSEMSGCCGDAKENGLPMLRCLDAWYPGGRGCSLDGGDVPKEMRFEVSKDSCHHPQCSFCFLHVV